MDVPEDALRALESGEPCRFADLESSCPSTPGVYTLWDGEVLLYAGIARVDPAETKNPQAGGIRGRLRGYPQNRLDSDFAVTIFLRFILPSLSSEDCAKLAAGEIGIREMSQLVRSHVEPRVTFRAWTCDRKTAARIESHIRRNGLAHAGKPAFNPSD